MWTCTTCMPGPEEGQKEVSVFQELESQIISSHQVGAGNRRLTGAHYWGANSSAQVPLLISSWASMLAWSYLTHFLVFVCQGQQPSQTHHFLIFFFLAPFRNGPNYKAHDSLLFTIWLMMAFDWSSCFQLLNCEVPCMALLFAAYGAGDRNPCMLGSTMGQY